ncbi:hypothetical protein P9H32_15515 [Pontiella sp. NLcol2]|uniref:Iota-carrageenase n=2 Tax=Pontiella agarivorans TaxID=3038953 RepID=A0ABU5N0R7_9BACT|nr:hypothetical protein [Pontiella agarivorans]
MKIKLHAIAILLFVFPLLAQANYTETMAAEGLEKNLGKDYNLVDDHAENDQSEKVQHAIDDMADAGGGRLIIPKGTYSFRNIHLKSNVHLLIEKGAVIKPDWPVGDKICVFTLHPESGAAPDAFIENVSIRGLGGRWTVDYSDRFPRKGEGARAVICRMVRNFLIADLDVRDNYTVYCGLTLSPTSSRDPDAENWDVSRATDGTIRNCRIFNGSPGYGLVQLHGAQNVHFENLYADGGVALRLETGAGFLHTGVFNITARNIVCENGRCAVMMGPHSAMNGKVTIENVKAIGCTYAVQLGQGGVKANALKLNPNAKPGIFSKGSSIKNIHAVFGMNAQLKNASMQLIPEAYFKDLRLWYDNKFMSGPSIAPVYDASEDQYDVTLSLITAEGFTYNKDKKILFPEDAREGKWAVTFKNWKSKYGTRETRRPVKGD